MRIMTASSHCQAEYSNFQRYNKEKDWLGTELERKMERKEGPIQEVDLETIIGASNVNQESIG